MSRALPKETKMEAFAAREREEKRKEREKRWRLWMCKSAGYGAKRVTARWAMAVVGTEAQQ